MLSQDPQPAPSFDPDNHEIELKFLTTASGFKSIQQWPALAAEPRPRAQRLITRYFDTENADLERNNIVLRVRSQRKSHTLTVKWHGDFSGGPFQRGEVEAACEGPEPDPSLLGPEMAEMLAAIIRDEPLIAVYETDFRRITRRATSDSSVIEVAFDAGFIRAGERKSAIREIELELKSGDPSELYDLGILLAQSHPVRLGMLAKAERGAQLRNNAPPRIVRAASPLAGNPSIEEAIGRVINACIGQFIRNFPAFETGDAITAVHQMRVAMRRLRALLKLFHRAFPCAEFRAFSGQARQIAATLGEGRNWDVFLHLLREGPAAAFPDEAGFATIFAAAEARRAHAYTAIEALLAAPETTCFVLSLQAFIARRAWRNALYPEAISHLGEPAEEFAQNNLRRMHAKLRKRGKHLQTLPPHQRHALRIGLKNIRYAGELFGGLFANQKPLRLFLKSATRLQDQLGAYNDLVTASGLLGQLETSDTAAHATGIIAGWCAFGAIPNDAALLRTWKKFKKAKL